MPAFFVVAGRRHSNGRLQKRRPDRLIQAAPFCRRRSQHIGVLELPTPDSPRLKENNFDLLRLLLAVTVCLVHSYDLSGFEQLNWITTIFSAVVAVKAFFVVSGFLIFMSFERSSSLSSYAGKRIRRIYPAYVTVVMLCAIGLFAVNSQGVAQHFSAAWWKYVLSHLVFLNFLQPSLPGVFEANKLAAVNGALWTLKIEVMFYLVVPLFVFLFRRFGRLQVLVLTYGLSIAYAALCAQAAERTGSGLYLELGRQLPGQLSYFMAGAFFYYHLDVLERHAGRFLAAALAILAVNLFWPLAALEPFALATVVVYFGLFLYVGNAGKFGDFSYGVYIVHFPIIQLLLHWGRLDGWSFLLATLCITAGCGILLWHLVEKRFLFRSSHYVESAVAG
jgi:peptidoglycan/LPS O-acetylase OafA/YrhL